MPSNKYFDFSFDNSFEGKCNVPSWSRTSGVDRQLCELLSSSRDSPITYSQVRSLTGWEYLMIRKWFAVLLSADVFTDDGVSRTQRWRLTRGFPEDRASLAELIPPIGSTIRARQRTDNQATSNTTSSLTVDIITNIVDEDYRLPGCDTDEPDDFYSVFSRI